MSRLSESDLVRLFKLIQAGRCFSEIAEILGTTRKTVSEHARHKHLHMYGDRVASIAGSTRLPQPSVIDPPNDLVLPEDASYFFTFRPSYVCLRRMAYKGIIRGFVTSIRLQQRRWAYPKRWVLTRESCYRANCNVDLEGVWIKNGKNLTPASDDLSVRLGVLVMEYTQLAFAVISPLDAIRLSHNLRQSR